MFGSRKRKYDSFSDEELIRDFKINADQEVLGVIYERYGHLVLGACLKYLQNEADAQDLVMSVFEKLPGKLMRHEISFFRSWLYTLTRNECFMLLRAKKRIGGPLNDQMLPDLENEESERRKEKEEMLDRLEELIPELKDEQEKCIRMFYLDQMSYESIGGALGIPVRQVKSALQNGKRNLRIKLENGK